MDIQTSVTEAPALSYDPLAQIVYNASHTFFAEDKPEKISAHEISTLSRNERHLGNRVKEFGSSIEKVKEYLVENYDELELHADEIARLLRIELTNTVEVTFQVEVTATVTLPVGKDFDDLSEYDFEVTIESSNSDYEIESYDADITRMRES